MRDTRFDLDQVLELRRIERARMRSGGEGFRGELQGLITRLTSGGVGSPAEPAGEAGRGRKKRKGAAKLPDRDPRILTQAKILWDKGFGEVVDAQDFSVYLAGIPDIPAFPETYDTRFPHVVLVDRRVKVVEACQMLGVSFDGNNDTIVPHDPKQVPGSEVYWIRIQDGKLHRNHKPSVCREEFVQHGDEVGLDDLEGLALFAQHPDTLEINTAIDLPGSVRVDDRGNCAYLKRWSDDVVKLRWRWDDYPLPGCGSASRGECIA